MAAVIDYVWQSSFCLLFFYGIYFFFLKGEKVFTLTRVFILVTPVLALLFPLLEIPVSFSKPSISLENTHFYQSMMDPANQEESIRTYGLPEVMVTGTKLPLLWEFQDYLIAVYLLLATLLFFRLFYQFLLLRMLWERGWYQTIYKLKEKYFLVPTYGVAPVFSFFNKLFWDDSSRLEEEEKKQILQHELEHIQQGHSWDVLYYQILSILFWFNPGIHLMRTALVDTHEYLADEKVLQSSSNKENYSKLIVKIAFKGLDLPIGNYFIRSTTLKRILMMKKTAKINWFKLFMVLPFTIMLVTLVSMKTESRLRFSTEMEKQEQLDLDRLKKQLLAAQDSIDVGFKVRKLKSFQHYEYIHPLKEGVLKAQLSDLEYEFTGIDSDEEYIKVRTLLNTLRAPSNIMFPFYDKVFLPSEVDREPAPSKGMQAWYDYLMETVPMPEKERELGLGSLIEIEFVVNETGKIQNPRVKRSFGGGLDKAMIRAMTDPEAPKWEAGKKNGKDVPVVTATSLMIASEKAHTAAHRFFPVNPSPSHLSPTFNPASELEPNDKDVFDVVENMPVPPGGMEGWNAYLEQNLKYPETAKANGIEGTVYLSFIVSKEGEIHDVEILRGIGGGADEEALRVVETSPHWTPGIQKGVPVDVKMRLPIRFKLPAMENKEDVSTDDRGLASFEQLKSIAELSSKSVKPTRAFNTFMSKKLIYPRQAREQNIQGTIYAKVKLDGEGNIRNASLIRGLHPEMDNQVLELLGKSPGWDIIQPTDQPVGILAIHYAINGMDAIAARSAKSVTDNLIQVAGYGHSGSNKSGISNRNPFVLEELTNSGITKNITKKQVKINRESEQPLYFLDGKELFSLEEVNPETIESMRILKSPDSVEKYGEKGKNGVIFIKTKQ